MNHSSTPLGLQYDLVDCIGYNWLTKYSNWNKTYVSFIKGSPSILKFERLGDKKIINNVYKLGKIR